MTDRTISRVFTDGDESAELLISWWETLNEQRGERANLRRAASPSEVAFGSAFHRLLGRLRGKRYVMGTDGRMAVAAVAGLAAHVKSHIGGASIAQQMAAPRSPGAGARVVSAALSERQGIPGLSRLDGQRVCELFAGQDRG